MIFSLWALHCSDNDSICQEMSGGPPCATSEHHKISWQCNPTTHKVNNQIMFSNQNNCQNQILSIVVYHKDKPIPEFDYFIQISFEENLNMF